jgi:hypothetical protein
VEISSRRRATNRGDLLSMAHNEPWRSPLDGTQRTLEISSRRHATNLGDLLWLMLIRVDAWWCYYCCVGRLSWFLVRFLVEYLTTNYGINSQVTELLDSIELIVVVSDSMVLLQHGPLAHMVE